MPGTSSYYVAAQTAAIRLLVSGPAGGASEGDLRQAADMLARLPLDDATRHQLTVEVLMAALDWAARGSAGAPGGQPLAPVPAQRPSGAPLLGWELTERSLRFGLESNYRALARLTSSSERRIKLVDKANELRPRTWT